MYIGNEREKFIENRVGNVLVKKIKQSDVNRMKNFNHNFLPSFPSQTLVVFIVISFELFTPDCQILTAGAHCGRVYKCGIFTCVIAKQRKIFLGFFFHSALISLNVKNKNIKINFIIFENQLKAI